MATTDTKLRDFLARIEALARNVEVEWLAQVNGYSYNPQQIAALRSALRGLDEARAHMIVALHDA